jgi:hypothetical protein
MWSSFVRDVKPCAAVVNILYAQYGNAKLRPDYSSAVAAMRCAYELEKEAPREQCEATSIEQL